MLSWSPIALCVLLQTVVGRVEKLNHELAPGTPGSVDEFVLTADATRIVCAAQRESGLATVFGLLVGDVDAPAFEVREWTGQDRVLRFALTADEGWVVDLIREAFTRNVLYSRRAEGSEDRVLLEGGVSALGFALAPDGTVVYVDDNLQALWANAPSGGHRRRLSADAGELYSVRAFTIAPGGTHTFYRSDEQPGPAVCLRSVALDGSAPSVQVSGTPAGNVTEFAVSHDGTRALYLADQTAVGTFELFLSGPPALPVSGPLVAGGDVTSFAFAPDGSAAVYIADQDQDETLELYAVPLLGGPGVPVELSGALVAGGDVLDFRIGPDSLHVLLRGDLRIDGVEELFVVPLDGSSPPLALSGPLVAGGDVRAAYAFDDTGTRALYLADAFVDEHDALFSVPLDLSRGPVRLNDPLVIGGDVAPDFVCHAGTVLYRAEQDVDDVAELHAVAVDGGPTTRLSAPLDGGRTVTGFRLAAGGTQVAYRADAAADERYEVFLVPVDGSIAPLRAHPPVRGPVPGIRNVLPLDDGRVLYLVDGGLYLVPADHGEPIRLSDPVLTVPDSANGWAVSPDGRELAFTQDIAGDGSYRLFSIALDGSRPRMQLSTRRMQLTPLNPQFTPDSARVVFQVGPSFDVADLMVAPADASAPALQLDGAENFDRFGITPNGSRVFYRNLSGGFSAPVNGSASATPLPDVDARFTFTFSPDSTRLVYVDHVRSDRLYTAPLAGGAALQLSTTAVQWYELTPDRERAVYASGTALHSVPTDGHLAPVQLGTWNGAQGLVFPDSQQVIFSSFSGIHIAPVDGSAPPTELVTGGGVQEFELTPDDGWVVFRDAQARLKSVNVAGAPVLQILSLLDCRELVVERGGGRVLFTVDSSPADVRRDLYVGDPAGRFPTQRISTHEVGLGVQKAWFTGGARRALYIAEEHLGGPELFAVPLPKPVRRR